MLNINTNLIRAFKFTTEDRIFNTTLQNLVNQEYNDFGLVEMKLFGISHVYSLIDFSKIKSFNGAKLLNRSYINNNVKKFLELNYEVIPLTLAKIVGDCPVEKNVNMKSNSIILDDFNMSEWILLYQLKNIINGMNEIIYDRNEITYSLSFGNTVEDENCPFDISLLDFDSDDKNDFPANHHKYILKYPHNNYEFSNTIYNDDFEGVFINIPEFKCWQYLSKKKYKYLKQAKKIEVTYATTDKPRCFSEVGYHQEYFMDTFSDLLKYSIYIPMDIHFSKLFYDYDQPTFEGKSYDALAITVFGKEYQTSVLLTHDELGINRVFGTKNTNIYTHKSVTGYFRYMDNFCLLKLINKIIRLKP